MKTLVLDTERAWAAGFFDGEGNIRLRSGSLKSRPGYQLPQVQVAQVDRELLDRFCAVVQTGKVYGPYGPYQTNKQPFWTYVATGWVNCRQVWETVEPYLGTVKGVQFMEVMSCEP